MPEGRGVCIGQTMGIPHHPRAIGNQRGNVGAFDRLWNAGVREEVCTVDGSPTLIGVTVNTNRHMYIFELTRGSTYCRAARFVATNKGVVFDQNFRKGLEAYRIEDNREAM